MTGVESSRLCMARSAMRAIYVARGGCWPGKYNDQIRGGCSVVKCSNLRM